MIDSKQLKAWAPGIAIAVILVVFVVAKFLVLPAMPPKAAPEATKPAAAPTPTPPPAPAEKKADATATIPPAAATKPTPVPAAATPPLSELPPPAPSQDPVVPAAWSAFHGGPDLAGYSDATFPDQPAQRWQYLADGAVRQPPVADSKGLYVATATGNVIAFNFDGTPRWTKQLSRAPAPGAAVSAERLNAPLTCALDTLFVGSQSGMLYALDTATGESRWTYDVHGEILGGANVHTGATPDDTRVFIIERSDGILHALNFKTGEVLWHTEPLARCDGSPAIANGLLAYGSCDSAIHVYNAQAGRLVRNIPLCDDCQVAGGVAVVGDDVYAGNRSGRVFRANLRTGTMTWTNTDTTKEVFSTPAIGKDLVLFGAEDGALYAVDRATGKQKWRVDLGAAPSSALIVGGKAAVSAGGKLSLRNLESGDKIWEHEVSDAITAPALIADALVVGSEDGTVVAFGAK